MGCEEGHCPICGDAKVCIWCWNSSVKLEQRTSCERSPLRDTGAASQLHEVKEISTHRGQRECVFSVTCSEIRLSSSRLHSLLVFEFVYIYTFPLVVHTPFACLCQSNNNQVKQIKHFLTKVRYFSYLLEIVYIYHIIS